MIELIKVFWPLALIILFLVGLVAVNGVRGTKDEHSDREQQGIINKGLAKYYEDQHKKAK